MRISYNKLWHLMLDKKMNKADLRRATGVSTATIAKLDKGENVTTDILVRICKVKTLTPLIATKGYREQLTSQLGKLIEPK